MHESFQPSPPSVPRVGFVTYAVFVVLALWTVLLTVVGQFLLWLFAQLMIADSGSWPSLADAGVSVGLALLVALPAAIFVAGVRSAPRLRAYAGAWLLAALALALLAAVRLLPSTSVQLAALIQILLGFSLAWICRRLKFATRLGLATDVAPAPGSALARPSATRAFIALALAALLAWPWVYWGALGSPLDTLLALLVGLSFGALAAAILGTTILPTRAGYPRGPHWAIFLGGLAASVMLVLLTAAYGFSGSQAVLLLVLSPLGPALLALTRADDTRPALLLAGLAAAVPPMFVDLDEITILLFAPGDLPLIVMRTTAVGGALAILISIALIIVGPRIARRHPAAEATADAPLALNPPKAQRSGFGLATLGAGLAWLTALVLYLVAGQSGFYGDRLFVIMRDQADVSAAQAIGTRPERIGFVYHTLTEHANRSQADLRATLDRFGVRYTPYYLVNALEVDGGPLVRALLVTRGDIDRVLDSPHLRPLPNPLEISVGPMNEVTEPPWNLSAIGVPRVWEELGVRGAGIVVGQSDSGVQWDHPALRAHYRGRDGDHDYNWLDLWYNSPTPTDYGGHGTHTIGTVLGDIVGVAPAAEFFACANLQRNIGNPALYLGCLQFMLAPYPRDGDAFSAGDPARAAHVLNNSWGCPTIEGCDPTALGPAVRALRAAGIFVVASAGNSGPRCGSISDPLALYDDAFSVGAVDNDGLVTNFSSRGPVLIDGSGRAKPDIVAPGLGILSTFPGNSYDFSHGTSMAGPHVVGVVALMWSANPALIGDIERTEQILLESATPPPDSSSAPSCVGPEDALNNAYGGGRLDAYAAVRAALGK